MNGVISRLEISTKAVVYSMPFLQNTVRPKSVCVGSDGLGLTVLC